MVIAEHQVVGKQSFTQRWIELELHQRDAGMLANEVRSSRVRVVEDIRVGVRLTYICEVRIRLAIANRHAEPECGMQLEVPSAASPILFGLNRRVLGYSD